jgi:hypothetical protein
MITTRRVLVLTPKADWEVILLVVVVVVVVSEKNMKMPVASRVLPVINGKGDLKMDDNDGEFEHLPRPLWLRKDDKGKEVLCLFSWRAPIDRWTDLDCHLFYKEEGGYTQDQMQQRAFENHGNDAQYRHSHDARYPPIDGQGDSVEEEEWAG